MIITVQRTISMGHRLPSYKGECSNPHGHNLKVVANVQVPETVFLDFKHLDTLLFEVLQPMDHAMVLATTDPFRAVLVNRGFKVYDLFTEPTTEAMAHDITTRLQAKLPNHHPIISLTVHETEKYSVTVTP